MRVMFSHPFNCKLWYIQASCSLSTAISFFYQSYYIFFFVFRNWPHPSLQLLQITRSIQNNLVRTQKFFIKFHEETRTNKLLKKVARKASKTESMHSQSFPLCHSNLKTMMSSWNYVKVNLRFFFISIYIH